MNQSTARRLAVVTIALTLAANACTRSQAPPVANADTTRPQPALACGTTRTERYAEHPGFDANLTSLDVYLPQADAGSCGARPLVVWVHGGAWTGGDKSEYMTDKIRLFNQAGYVFASIN